MTNILLTNLTIRAPREDELEAVCELLNICDVADCGQPDSPLDQLRGDWHYPGFHLESDARIALEPGGRIVGYASARLYKRVFVRCELRVHPAYRTQDLGGQLCAFMVQRSQEFVALDQSDTRIVLQDSCHHGDQFGGELREAAGMVCNRQTWAMEIDLSEEPPQPVWPEGITLRPFDPERASRAVFEATDEAFQDHWGHVSGGFADWYQRQIVNQENFDPSLWFIAMDGNEIAGVSLCGYYLGDGIVDNLAVRRPWRRRGLGLALLHHTFGEFYRQDVHKVCLGVDSQNLTGAVRLYERAGMHVLLTYDHYEKELRAGIDLSTQTLQA